jgi:hypothetical protein
MPSVKPLLAFQAVSATAWLVTEAETGQSLGKIRWYTPWQRSYCFFPNPLTAWDSVRLFEVVAFIDDQMEARKKNTCKPAAEETK